MADNVAVTAGSGTTIGTDDISGVHIQRVKLSCGPDGTATDVPVGGGVQAAALRVTIASDSTGVIAVSNTNALDYDSGGGTVNQALVGIALPASGGPVAGGTSTNPIVVRLTDGTTLMVVNANTAELQAAPKRSATGTASSVNDTASSTTLLSSNTSRLGATIVNDSTVLLYLKCGATASSTSYAYKLNPNDTVEIPFGYTGVIDGIWASDASGAARITEFT